MNDDSNKMVRYSKSMQVLLADYWEKAANDLYKQLADGLLVVITKVTDNHIQFDPRRYNALKNRKRI